jgi:hypothetical protein
VVLLRQLNGGMQHPAALADAGVGAKGRPQSAVETCDGIFETFCGEALTDRLRCLTVSVTAREPYRRVSVQFDQRRASVAESQQWFLEEVVSGDGIPPTTSHQIGRSRLPHFIFEHLPKVGALVSTTRAPAINDQGSVTGPLKNLGDPLFPAL